MEGKKMSEERANKIYDLLVTIGGAREDERVDFIYHHCEDKFPCTEWRFIGHLGFGGKYKSGWNGVSYYPENETPVIKALAETLNIELKKIV